MLFFKLNAIFKKIFVLSIYLAATSPTCGMWDLFSCSIWDLALTRDQTLAP